MEMKRTDKLNDVADVLFTAEVENILEDKAIRNKRIAVYDGVRKKAYFSNASEEVDVTCQE